MFPLVLPSEVMALPDIGPAVPAGVLASPPLEAVRLAGRVDVSGLGFAQQLAEVEEMLLRSLALRQRGGSPLVDELVRCHARAPDASPLSAISSR